MTKGKRIQRTMSAVGRYYTPRRYGKKLPVVRKECPACPFEGKSTQQCGVFAKL
jgi:hypothetical protein